MKKLTVVLMALAMIFVVSGAVEAFSIADTNGNFQLDFRTKVVEITEYRGTTTFKSIDALRSLLDWGHKGSISGNQYTAKWTKIDEKFNMKLNLEIKVTLNELHNLITQLDYQYSEEDLDPDSVYRSTVHFKAHGIPLSSASETKLVFKVTGNEVCQKIDKFLRVQRKNPQYKCTITDERECNNDSSLTVTLTNVSAPPVVVPPVIDRFIPGNKQINVGDTVYFRCEAHDPDHQAGEFLTFEFDLDGDGTYDEAWEGTPDGSIEYAVTEYQYNKEGIYRITCKVTDYDKEYSTKSIKISVGDSRLSVVARPNLGIEPLDTAIIPPDERFPAKYVVRLRDNTGQSIPDKNLKVSYPGKEFEITTDANGKAEFTYTYSGLPPEDGPLEIEITIECEDLNVSTSAFASVGLKLGIVGIKEIWEDIGGSVPHTMGMMIFVKDEFRPDLDVEEYFRELYLETGKSIGVHVTTRWRNQSEPTLFDSVWGSIQGFSVPPDDVLYNGMGWIEDFVEAWGVPYLRSGPHFLPAIKFMSEGLHLMEVRVDPIIDPLITTPGDTSDDSTLNYVESAWSPGFLFATYVYGAESVFQSIVCSFNPTDTQQFLAKTVILGCPLLTNTLWVGAAASPIAIALHAVTAAEIICDLMQGNQRKALADLASAWVSTYKGLADGKVIDLGTEQVKKIYGAYVLNFGWKIYKTGKDAYGHFQTTGRGTDNQFQSKMLQLEELLDEWPEGLSVDEFTDVIIKAMSGLMSNSEIEGMESLALWTSGEVEILDLEGKPLPADSYRKIEDQGVNMYLIPEKMASLSVLSSEDVHIFRNVRQASGDVEGSHYQIAIQGEPTRVDLVLFVDDLNTPCWIDRGDDGTIDETVSPVIVGRAVDPPTETNVAMCDAACQTTAPIIERDGYLDADFSYTTNVNILAGIIIADFSQVQWLTSDCSFSSGYAQAVAGAEDFTCSGVSIPVGFEDGWLFWMVTAENFMSLDWKNGPYDLLFFQIGQ